MEFCLGINERRGNKFIFINSLNLCFNMLDFFMIDFILLKLNNYYYYVILPFNYSIIYTIKFLISLFFLMFIRAGLPRYRYDYLTKLGWSKFLLLSLTVLLLNYFFFILWS